MKIIDMIKGLEEKIRQAQLTNNADLLDELIDGNLQFVFFDGSVATKEQDLAAHRKKLVLFHEIKFSEQVIQAFEDVATVTVKASISATVAGEKVNGVYRYGRTWALLNGKWKLIAGNVTTVS